MLQRPVSYYQLVVKIELLKEKVETLKMSFDSRTYTPGRHNLQDKQVECLVR